MYGQKVIFWLSALTVTLTLKSAANQSFCTILSLVTNCREDIVWTNMSSCGEKSCWKVHLLFDLSLLHQHHYNLSFPFPWCVCVCVCVCEPTRACTNMHVCMCLCICMCVHVHVSVCECVLLSLPQSVLTWNSVHPWVDYKTNAAYSFLSCVKYDYIQTGIRSKVESQFLIEAG